MSAHTASELLSPDEQFCEEFAHKLHELQADSYSLAHEVTLATPLLREQGLPLSEVLLEGYRKWSVRRSELAVAVAPFVGLASIAGLPLPDWKRALDRKRNELRASRDRDAAAILEVTEILQRVQGLQVAKGESLDQAEINAPRQLAGSLLDKMADHATRRSALDDASTIKSLRAILCLIDGTLDSEAEEQADDVVRSEFSRKLAIALVGGRITAPARKVNPTSHGATQDYLSPDEATKRLTFGQADPNPPSVRTTTTSTTSTAALTSPIHIEDLIRIGQRMQADVPGLYDSPLLSEAYSAVIDGIGYVEAVVKDPRRLSEPGRYAAELTQSLYVLAAIQSAMRVAAFPVEDDRQVSVYRWLFQTAKEQSIFISRHMKIDDPADPKKFKEWVEQIKHARRKWDSPRRLTKVLNKIQHELKKTHDDSDAWEAVFRAVEEITGTEKIPPSYVPLRETLLPHLDHLPADLTPPDSFQQVLRAIDDYHRTLEQRQVETEAPQGQQNPEVQEVARLLKGRAVVLIGGEVDQLAKARLERVFGLSELIWLEAHHEQSVERFAAPVQRPDVVLVMVVIRWMSHGHGDVKQYCDPLGKPFVRLQGTTHPNRVANDVLRQCGDVLRAKYGAVGAELETSAAG